MCPRVVFADLLGTEPWCRVGGMATQAGAGNETIGWLASWRTRLHRQEYGIV